MRCIGLSDNERTRGNRSRVRWKCPALLKRVSGRLGLSPRDGKREALHERSALLCEAMNTKGVCLNFIPFARIFDGGCTRSKPGQVCLVELPILVRLCHQVSPTCKHIKLVGASDVFQRLL